MTTWQTLFDKLRSQLARGRREAPDTVTVETKQGSFVISTDRSRLNLEAIHNFLSNSYWAKGISQELVARSIAHSLCFGLYTSSGQQVGFARVVTDDTTFAYLCDVYVLEDYRGLALGKALMRVIVDHPVLQRVRRALLATRDAHGLYKQFGFDALAKPEVFMEINRPDIYVRRQSNDAAAGGRGV